MAFYGKPFARTLKAEVFEHNGEVIAVVGYYFLNGWALVFSDIMETAPRLKMRVWREAVRFMGKLTFPALCVADEGSGPFLTRLGWQFVGPSGDGDVYSWRD